MRNRLLVACAALLFSVALATPVPAQTPASKAVKTMAGILVTVNHFPTDAQKATLKALAEDTATGAQDKVLIQALIGLQHSVSAADKPKVEAVAKDQAASEGTRSIAAILGRFLHTAGDADKATLNGLAK